MAVRIKATPPYERRVVKILTPTERERLENDIAAHPERWPVVGGTGGVRKARVKVGARGKSGGARAIYFLHSLDAVVYMLTIYTKDEQEDLSEADKKAIKALVSEIKKAEDVAVQPRRKRKGGRT
jgi:mRNA-degrading endonuclease RelE of RelBE toxin-antitoxin system